MLCALRQVGLLDGRGSGTAPASNERIPLRIVQFWDSPEPPTEIKELIDGWRSVHPKFEHLLFNDVSAREFIAASYPSSFVEAFDRARGAAQRADLFRLAYLAANGGYYVDVDDRCLSKLDDSILGEVSLCLYQEDFGTIGNDFLGAIPRHPVILKALSLAVSAVNRGDNEMLWLCTGPGLMTRALAQILATSGSDLSRTLAGTTILELWEVERIAGLHCMLAYKKTGKYWTRSIFRAKS